MQKILIAWETIDECKTADEVAELLRINGIRGIPCYPYRCPLANATGWKITEETRIKLAPDQDCYTIIELTLAEREFVIEFDYGGYDDLAQE